jgi:hypothetical protein
MYKDARVKQLSPEPDGTPPAEGQEPSGSLALRLDGLGASSKGSSPVQTEADSQQSTPQRRPSRGSSGSAATMLKAASTLAQTPAQNVSNALLGKVQMVAAQEQTRRSSLPGSTAWQASGQANGESVKATAPNYTQHQSTSSDQLHKAAPGDMSTFGFSIDPPIFSSDEIPASPRSAATMQVSSIAAKTAANEYVDQVAFLSSHPASHNIPAPKSFQHSFFPQQYTQTSQQRSWDDSNPFQGVPSLPCECNALLRGSLVSNILPYQ